MRPYGPPRFLTALTTAALVLVATSTSHAIELLSGLGGPGGYGDGNLAINDDSSSSEIDITGAFPGGMRFFGMTFTSLYVNNNGNISYGGSLATYTPEPFPISNQRMIAPWWADVDTRGGGLPARNGVYWSIAPRRVVVTWHNVGYYNIHDDLSNDFQLVLTAAGTRVGDFDVEFRYHTCQWTTGDASMGSMGFGGTPAQAGFDAGNLRDYIALPGSRTMDVLRLCDTSNVGVAGLWRFAIRDGSVMCPGMDNPCATGRPGVCAPGRITCSGTTPVCTSLVMASPEQCDGLDNDCNGRVDDAIAPRACYTGPANTRAVGACRDGTQYCAGGTFTACMGQVLPSAERCNLADDDCNRLVDDIAGAQVCGVGACRRTASPCAGGVVPPCVPGAPSAEFCNGLDDDCDGVVDNRGACPEPPEDAGPEPTPEAGVDAGQDVAPDVRPDVAGEVGVDAGNADGACHDYHCDRSLRLDGRAGPFGGCGCRTQSPSRGGAATLAMTALVLLWRRRRRSVAPRKASTQQRTA